MVFHRLPQNHTKFTNRPISAITSIKKYWSLFISIFYLFYKNHKLKEILKFQQNIYSMTLLMNFLWISPPKLHVFLIKIHWMFSLETLMNLLSPRDHKRKWSISHVPQITPIQRCFSLFLSLNNLFWENFTKKIINFQLFLFKKLLFI